MILFGSAKKRRKKKSSRFFYLTLIKNAVRREKYLLHLNCPREGVSMIHDSRNSKISFDDAAERKKWKKMCCDAFSLMFSIEKEGILNLTHSLKKHNSYSVEHHI